MIVTMKLDEHNKLVGATGFQRDSWVNLVNPTQVEIYEISKLYNIPIEFLLDSLDPEESARIEYDEETNSTLLTNDFPLIDKNNGRFNSFITIPIGVVITKEAIITVCAENCGFLDLFIKRNVNPNLKSQCLLNILLMISTRYLDSLRQLERQRVATERQLRKTLHNKDLYDLLEIEKSLVYFLTSLKSNNNVLTRLPRVRSIKMYEDDMDLLEEVMIESRQGIETTELYTRILNSMTDTYSSLISNNMNNIMKLLTLVTIVLTIPTLVFSFYGMNVDLPLDELPLAWIVTIAFSLLFSGILVVFFRQRKLF